MLREIFESIDLTKTLLAVLLCSQCYLFTSHLGLQRDVRYLWDEVFTDQAPRSKRSVAADDGQSYKEANVEFIHPKLREEMGSQEEDPANPWVWLTSYSRIPVNHSVCADPLGPNPDAAPPTGGGHTRLLRRDKRVLSAWAARAEGRCGIPGTGGTEGKEGAQRADGRQGQRRPQRAHRAAGAQGRKGGPWQIRLGFVLGPTYFGWCHHPI